MRDGMPGGKWLAPFSSGWLINSENRLPFYNDHSIWLNGKHPRLTLTPVKDRKDCVTSIKNARVVSYNTLPCYMTSSVSGQDEPNRGLWLATRAGKMELSCPLGISRLVPQDQRSFFGVLSHIINPLLTKLVRSRWLDIGLVLFLRVYGRRLCLGP